MLTLIVEDGTGKEDSNSYVDLTYADEYMTANGRGIVWDGLTEQQQINALINGAQYMDSENETKYRGFRSIPEEQAMAFPRSGAYTDYNTLMKPLPKELKVAQMEYTYFLQFKKSSLFQSVTTGIKAKSSSVGAISKSITYTGSSSSVRVTIPEIDHAIKPLIKKNTYMFTNAV
jgi:hypothetical protein